MIKPKDEEWLRKVLQNCSKNILDSVKENNNLEGFKTIVGILVKDIEKMVDETWAL